MNAPSTEVGGAFGDDVRVVVVGGGDNDRSGERGRVGRLENTRSNEDTITTELHHELNITGTSAYCRGAMGRGSN